MIQLTRVNGTDDVQLRLDPIGAASFDSPTQTITVKNAWPDWSGYTHRNDATNIADMQAMLTKLVDDRVILV